MLLKTVRDANTSSDLHISAIYCSAKSIQVLNDAPIHERQLDVTILVQQYQQVNAKMHVQVIILGWLLFATVKESSFSFFDVQIYSCILSGF